MNPMNPVSSHLISQILTLSPCLSLSLLDSLTPIRYYLWSILLLILIIPLLSFAYISDTLMILRLITVSDHLGRHFLALITIFIIIIIQERSSLSLSLSLSQANRIKSIVMMIGNRIAQMPLNWLIIITLKHWALIETSKWNTILQESGAIYHHLPERERERERERAGSWIGKPLKTLTRSLILTLPGDDARKS